MKNHIRYRKLILFTHQCYRVGSSYIYVTIKETSTQIQQWTIIFHVIGTTFIIDFYSTTTTLTKSLQPLERSVKGYEDYATD
jgi:hypothetical protein